MLDDFPANLKDFIARHIESVAQMEALFLLRRDAGRQWSSDELSKSLYITNNMGDAMLLDLERRGFLVREKDSTTTYRYQPVDPGADSLIAKLGDIYQERRVAVITQIYSRPVDKVQTFADAFRLRREE
ncbi:MAG: hypothetical protein WD851_05100 [Pirellulales bacterium]